MKQLKKVNMSIKIDPILPKFGFGQIVFLITDKEQLERMVTGYYVREDLIRYYLAFGEIETVHSGLEIATDKNWNK